MNDNEREWSRRRLGQKGNGDMILILAAMVVVMALITLMLHRNSPSVDAGITPTSEPSTTGQRGVVPMRGRRDIER